MRPAHDARLTRRVQRHVFRGLRHGGGRARREGGDGRSARSKPRHTGHGAKQPHRRRIDRPGKARRFRRLGVGRARLLRRHVLIRRRSGSHAHRKGSHAKGRIGSRCGHQPHQVTRHPGNGLFNYPLHAWDGCPGIGP